MNATEFDPFRWADGNDLDGGSSREHVIEKMRGVLRDTCPGLPARAVDDENPYKLQLVVDEAQPPVSLRVTFVPATPSSAELALPGVPDVLLEYTIGSEKLVAYRIRSTQPIATLREHLWALHFARPLA